MLSVSELGAAYGPIRAITGVSLTVPDGGLVALVGANGAGKSTTLNVIAGLHKAASGTVTLDGDDVTRLSAHRVVRRGLCLVPEGRMVVAPLTVQENLDLSRFSRRTKGSYKDTLAYVFELFPRLLERRQQPAGLLSGGEQQMLALGRALMTRPTVLLLDEPSMGLAPSIVDLVFQAIKAIHTAGLSILLIEQNAAIAMDVSDYVYVLERGSVVLEGTPAELGDQPKLMEAYLG